MNDDKRGALATETYVFECDEVIGEIEVRGIDSRLDLGVPWHVSFVSTDGELRA